MIAGDAPKMADWLVEAGINAPTDQDLVRQAADMGSEIRRLADRRAAMVECPTCGTLNGPDAVCQHCGHGGM